MTEPSRLRRLALLRIPCEALGGATVWEPPRQAYYPLLKREYGVPADAEVVATELDLAHFCYLMLLEHPSFPEHVPLTPVEWFERPALDKPACPKCGYRYDMLVRGFVLQACPHCKWPEEDGPGA